MAATPDLKATIAEIDAMPLEKQQALRDDLMKVYAKPWLPQAGPQYDAFYSEADELLYGGAAGGGKTDLLVGLCTTAHRKSLIFRAQSVDLAGFWDRLNEVVPTPLKRNDVKHAMITRDGRVIEAGHLSAPGSERNWQGRPHDFIGFDEAAQLMELQVSFVLQWLRSTDAGQRKRAIFATNPPIPEIRDGQMVDTGLGDWLMRWWAPWLDDHFPNPAKEGELRWCYMVAEGDRLTTIWVDGPGAYDPITGQLLPDVKQEDIDAGKVSVARSRTFIRSLLKDNVFLSGTGYAEKLSSTPEPLKSMLLKGDFTVRGEDHPMQVIPTQWVLEGQRRWNERDEASLLRLRQLVLYADIAQGGADTTVLAPLLETDYFDELIVKPGKATPRGEDVGMLLLSERLDNSLIAVDATGGWGGATEQWFRDNHQHIEIELHKVSQSDGSWTPDQVYKYANLRAKMWWEFRLALDPQSQYRICLPPSSRLRVQLTTPHWYIRAKTLYIESKEEVRSRLAGASTDEADAVLGAWQYREQALIKIMNPHVDYIDKVNGRKQREHLKGEAVELFDPRGEW
jgi:hypothetical protein